MGKSLVFAFALVAVGGCDDTVYPTGTVGGGGHIADWDGVQDFLEANCESCHSAGGIGGSVFPDDIVAERDGVAELIVPFDPEASNLWLSLNEDPDTPAMPLGREDPLNPAAIQFIKLWILEGALLE